MEGPVKQKAPLTQPTRKKGQGESSHAELTSFSSAPLSSPKINGAGQDRSTRCLKCQGLLVVQPTASSETGEIRCVNCGWQPRGGMRVMTESEEARAIRHRTAQLFNAPTWHTSTNVTGRASSPLVNPTIARSGRGQIKKHLN